jgi:hypothetical protein
VVCGVLTHPFRTPWVVSFAEFSRQQIAALLLGTDPFFQSRRDQIVALANRTLTGSSWFAGERLP